MNRRYFYPDVVTVVKADGTEHESVSMQVTNSYILTMDADVHIEAGDKIIRPLARDNKETLMVIDSHFVKSSSRNISDHYRIEYERKGSQRRSGGGVHIGISGSPQTHVNVESIDQSVSSIMTGIDEVFHELRGELRKEIKEESIRDLLLNAVSEMERSRGTSQYTEAYKKFITVASQHMAVVAPFIPSLTSLITN